MDVHYIDLASTLAVYRTVRIFCPVQIQGQQLDRPAVEQLRCISCLDRDEVIAGLHGDLPAYQAAVDGVTLESNSDKVKLWNRQTLAC